MRTSQVGGLVTSPDDDDERLYAVKRGRVRIGSRDLDKVRVFAAG